ncbi:ATP-binding protein [Nocardia sp. NBC_00565]|uniref:ATP-binding protein n=1 Tax=Nocardia sp. NBC_00565 TaxID=2975993 RepID=UPI002E81D074|nr:ATP-binding protein [Nocardia sp. NBC_00565]WUC02660.1 ATP-binding protein [Nocardia sp. NBC_00565]
MRVAQGIFAHTRWRNLEQWRVRWKVGAAVALPLAAAMLLGSLRLMVVFRDYSEYDGAAARIADIPAITALESAASTVAGGQVYGTTTDQDLVELSTAITEATVRAGRKGIDASVARAMKQMTATSEVIRSGGKRGSDPFKAAELNNAIVADAIGTVDKLLTPIHISSIVAAKAQLSDVLVGKVEGFNWLLAAMSAIQQPTQVEEFHTAQGRLVSTIDAAERAMPAAKPELDRVRGNTLVLKDLTEESIRTQTLNLVEARRLAIDSRDVFTQLTNEIVQNVMTEVDDQAAATRSAAVQASLVVLGTLIAALGLALLVARSLLRPLRRLRAGAHELAEKELPNEVERIMHGTQLEQIAVRPVPVHTGEEIGEIARTVDGLHAQALKLAAQQQLLRDQVNDMFETMARRNQTLVDRQLSMIESLEFEEKDPERLGHLFRLDHLAARMRRNSANLLVLAGTRSRHDRSGPVEVRDILRAAVSEVEDYPRVKSGKTPDGWVAGIAATDVVHLIAEMLENALRASPPKSDVTFAYSRTSEGGLLIEVIDEGIGIVATELNEINERLAKPTAATVATTRQMGLFVVGKLAERHGITVRLRRTHDRALSPGITASLHIPPALIEVPSQDPDDPATLKPVIPVHRDVLGSARTAQSVAPAPKAITPPAKPAPAARRIGAPPSTPAEVAAAVAGAPPVITSYGLPKRVPGVNRKGRRKGGGAAAAATSGTTSSAASLWDTPADTSTPAPSAAGTAATGTADPGTAAPGTTTTGASTSAESAPGTAAPATSASDASAPATSVPGASAPSTSAPGTSAPAASATATSAPAMSTSAESATGTAAPAASASATSDSGASVPGASVPGTSGPGTSATAASAAGTSVPSASAPATGASATGTPAATASSRDTSASGTPAAGTPASSTSATGTSAPVASARAASATGTAAPGTSPTTSPRGESGAGAPAPTTSPRGISTSGAPATDTSATGKPTSTTPATAASASAPGTAASASNPAASAPTEPTAGTSATGTTASSASATDATAQGTAAAGAPTSAAPAPGTTASASGPAASAPTGPAAGESATAGSDSAAASASAGVTDAGPPTGPQERAAKATSFFQVATPGTQSAPSGANGQGADAVQPTSNGEAGSTTRAGEPTPIFAGMMSAWLADPTTGELPVVTNWNSAADEGWSRAQRVADASITARTTSGLPKRDPGNQLVPGGAESGTEATESAARAGRDPESIRAGLNSYARGVRDGRATGKLKPFAAEDVR